MKKLILCVAAISISVNALASDDVGRAIAGLILGIAGYAASQLYNSNSGYMVHQGRKVPTFDPFHDTGERALGEYVDVQWEKSESPKAACEGFSGSTGSFYIDGGCSVWMAGASPVCKIITKPVTTNEVLGRLFVACQKGV